MNRTIAAAAFCAATLTATPVFADTAANGPGTLSCHEFIDYRDKDKNADQLFFIWAQGFMSGINFARLGSENKKAIDLAQMSDDDQQAWLVDYCRNNLDDRYVLAVMHLMKSLAEKQGETLLDQ